MERCVCGPACESLESVGPASQRRDWARPPGRALRVLGRSARHVAPQDRRVRWITARALWRAQRAAPQSVGPIPLQRPHGAAPPAHVGLPAAAALRDAAVGGAALAPTTVGD